jgi:hypothetical protein
MLLTGFGEGFGTSSRMHFGDRSFEALIWPRPVDARVNWLELATLLTPRGKRIPPSHGPATMSLASTLAAKRLLVLSYANRIPVRVDEQVGSGRRPSVVRNAHFEGRDRRQLMLIVPRASGELDRGANWLATMPDRLAVAIAVWRATLLRNGLIRTQDTEFLTRVSTAELLAATDAMDIPAQLLRRTDGLRARLTASDANDLLDRLFDGANGSILQSTA